MDDEDSRTCGGRGIPGHFATAIFFLALGLIFTAYVTPDWLQVDESKAPQNFIFRKMGLWMSCYSDLHDPYYYDPYLTGGYQGCRWIYYPILASVYNLKEFIIPGFLVPVQICFSLCFLPLLVTIVLVFVYLGRYHTHHHGTVHFLIVLGMILEMSALLGTVGVIVFGSLSSSKYWAPDWQFNYLSWGFVVAVIGVVLEHLAAILFLAEASVQFRRQQRRLQGRQNMTAFGTGTGTKPPKPGSGGGGSPIGTKA